MDLLDEDEEDFDDELISFQDIKIKIPSFKSEKLCQMIVSSRYIGFGKELEKECMLELAKRRSNGEIFEFEKNIQDNLNSLPKLSFNFPDLREVLNNAIGSKLK